MHTTDFCLRLLAFSKASLLKSLEYLPHEDLLWQPAPGKCSIGWHACHVGQFTGALMDHFDETPDWDSLGILRQFGYDSRPDALRDLIPPRQELFRLIHEDWRRFVERFRDFTDADCEHRIPQNNADGQTLLDLCHQVSWHCSHHVGRICGLRSMLNKPVYPRPAFSAGARQKLTTPSDSGWEQILVAIDPAMPISIPTYTWAWPSAPREPSEQA
jgi:hypothetical protein